VRKININNEEWKYTIGRLFAVIKSPDNKRANVQLAKIKNVPQERIEAGRGLRLCEDCDGDCAWDIKNGTIERQKDGWIKPSDIKEFILKNLSLWKN
jgi:hypothetical protein